MSEYAKYTGPALSAGLLLLSFVPFEAHFLAWVALVPLLLALEGETPRRSFLLSLFSGLVFFPGLFYWIWAVSAYNVLDEVLLAAYLSPYFALWGLGVNFIRKRTGLSAAVVAPPLWVVLEYIRSHLGFLSLPWMLLGHSQYSQLALIQITSVTGVFGLSFLIVLVNCVIAELVLTVHQRVRATVGPSPHRVRRVPALAALVLVTITWLYGIMVLSTAAPPDRRIALALLQGNIPLEHYWSASHRAAIVRQYVSLTRDAARESPTLIVWPETAVPGDAQHHAPLRRALSRLSVETQSHVLVGSGEYAKFTDRRLEGKFHNSMSLFGPGGELHGHYRKIALIPFGEYEPLRGRIPWPKSLVAATGNFLPGDEYTIFNVGTIPFAAIICWESIFPDLVRQFVQQGAGFIVNATDESRFSKTAVPAQLLAMSVFRAVENRVAVARAGNTGITAIIEPSGKIAERLREPRGILLASVPVTPGGTFYTHYGDVFVLSQVAAIAVFGVWAIRRRAS